MSSFDKGREPIKQAKQGRGCQSTTRANLETRGGCTTPVGVRAGQDMDVRLAPLAAGPLVFVGGQVDDRLGVAVVRAAHDCHMRRPRRGAVSYAQR